MEWLENLLDKHAPGWREDTRCPVCDAVLHPLEVRRHLEAVHGITAGRGPERPEAK